VRSNASVERSGSSMLIPMRSLEGWPIVAGVAADVRPAAKRSPIRLAPSAGSTFPA